MSTTTVGTLFGRLVKTAAATLTPAVDTEVPLMLLLLEEELPETVLSSMSKLQTYLESRVGTQADRRSIDVVVTALHPTARTPRFIYIERGRLSDTDMREATAEVVTGSYGDLYMPPILDSKMLAPNDAWTVIQRDAASFARGGIAYLVGVKENTFVKMGTAVIPPTASQQTQRYGELQGALGGAQAGTAAASTIGNPPSAALASSSGGKLSGAKKHPVAIGLGITGTFAALLAIFFVVKRR